MLISCLTATAYCALWDQKPSQCPLYSCWWLSDTPDEHSIYSLSTRKINLLIHNKKAWGIQSTTRWTTLEPVPKGHLSKMTILKRIYPFISTLWSTSSLPFLMLNISFRRMGMYRKQTFEIQSNLCTTMATLRKWQGNGYIQGDHYTQVNSAENIRQLKILRSCPVTVIHRVMQGCCIQVWL